MSVGGGAALFVALVVLLSVERAIRRREARKRGITAADYEPTEVARRAGQALVALLALFLALVLAAELSDVLA